MKVITGLILMIIANILFMRTIMKILKDIRKRQGIFWIILLREFFLGVSGFYFIVFLVGLLLVLTSFNKP